nr:triple gene block protein 1 [Wheat stripe mosaic virus]
MSSHATKPQGAGAEAASSGTKVPAWTDGGPVTKPQGGGDNGQGLPKPVGAGGGPEPSRREGKEPMVPTVDGTSGESPPSGGSKAKPAADGGTKEKSQAGTTGGGGSGLGRPPASGSGGSSGLAPTRDPPPVPKGSSGRASEGHGDGRANSAPVADRGRSSASEGNGSTGGDGVSAESAASQHRHTVLTILKEAGFVVTNQNMSYVDKFKLDRSKALASLKQLLEKRLVDTKDANMMVLQDQMMQRIDEIDFSKWAAKVGIVEGCAGSGKTTALLKCKEALGAKALVITHSTEQLMRAFHGISAVYTPLDVMTREENYSEPHVLLVDEYTKLHMCEIICCAAFLGCRSVFLFGDAKQGLSHGLGSEKHYSFSIIAKSDTCHRLPEAGRDFLNKTTGRDVKGGKNKKKGSVDCGDIYQRIPHDAAILCFTPETKKRIERELSGVVLVSDAQGATYENVALFIYKCDLQAMRDPNLLEVALTRQKNELVVCFESQELYAMLVNQMVKSCCKHQSTAQL